MIVCPLKMTPRQRRSPLVAPVLTAKTWPLPGSGSPRTAAYQGRSAVMVAGGKTPRRWDVAGPLRPHSSKLGHG